MSYTFFEYGAKWEWLVPVIPAPGGWRLRWDLCSLDYLVRSHLKNQNHNQPKKNVLNRVPVPYPSPFVEVTAVSSKYLLPLF